jgi:hypothetical protein
MMNETIIAASSLGFQLGNSENNLRFAFRTAVGTQRGQLIASEFRTLVWHIFLSINTSDIALAQSADSDWS